MITTQLVICGSIAVDRLLSFDGLFKDKIQPDKLDVLSMSVLMDRMEIVHGGIGPNIARSAAALGITPILTGSIGQDGKEYLDFMAQAGVDTTHVHISDTPTASFVAFSDKSGNQVSGFYPGAMADSASVSFRDWKGKDALICLSAHDPSAMKRQVTECREHNLRLCYDPGQQILNTDSEDIVAGCEVAEIVFMNEYELGMFLEKAHLSLEQTVQLAGTLVVTKGKNGSVVYRTGQGEPLEIPIAQPKDVVDPTGAGDAYRAGFLYGYIQGWDLQQCAQLGAVIGSFAVENHGVPTLRVKEIEARYKENFNEEITIDEK